jgi:Bax protein
MTIFERCALGVIGTLVVGIVVAALVVPVDVRATAPKAVFQKVSIPLTPRPRVQLASVALPAPDISDPSDHTVETLSLHFRNMGYDLKTVFTGDEQVPRVILASIPADLKDVREVKIRKALFFQTVLPLVLQVNEEIQADRERLWRVRVDQALGRKPSAVDRLWLAVLSEKYKVKRGDVDELLRRVDVVPPSLALAQAAEESGWGTSRFVREGNAIFGQWTFSKAHGITPKNRDEGKNHHVRAFGNLIDSVRAYVTNLNTHRAYRKFRGTRAELRQTGHRLSGTALAATMTSYSQRGEDYVRTIRRIMSANALAKLDGARLQADDDSGLRIAGEEPEATAIETGETAESAI